MQLLSFSSAASTAQTLNPALIAKPAKAPAAQVPSSAAPANAAPAPAPIARTSHSHAAPAGGGGGAAAAEAETLVSGYSTTIAGKQYSGSVEESGGQYTASVPSVPGASATGSSLAAAENNLSNRIDELV